MSKMRRRHRKAWIFSALGVLVIAAGAMYWFVWRTPPANAADSNQTTMTATASARTFQKTVTGTGTLTPTVNDSVNFAASGTVQSVDVKVGDTVAAGQQLATIDTLQLTADLTAAQANLAVLQAQLTTAKADSDGTDKAVAQIASLQAQVDLAQSQADTAQANMSEATLTAPDAGLVTAVNLAVGDTVTGQAGDTAQFTIVGTDAWTTSVQVDDADISHLSVGDQVEMTVDSLTDTIFGTVSDVGLIASTSGGTATFPVGIAVTGSPGGLHDGMSASVSIIYERRQNVLAIPTAAIRTENGTSVVDVVGAEGATTATEITVGEQSGEYTEVTAGLHEGDEVQYTVAVATNSTSSGGGSSDKGGATITGPDGQTFQIPDGATFGGGGQMPQQFTGGNVPGGGSNG